MDRKDGRTANQLRPLTCTRNVLNRAHGSASWSQGIYQPIFSAIQAVPFSCFHLKLEFLRWVYTCTGETKVLAAVYGPKAGTNKNENPEKACFEVIWKPKTGQIGEFHKTH